MSKLLEYAESLNKERRSQFPNFIAGDTIRVHLKIKEGEKERVQLFTGVVIQRRHPNTAGETFTVMKLVDGIAVERILPILSPNIHRIEMIRYGKVRRARIYYFTELRGKKAKIKENRRKNKENK